MSQFALVIGGTGGIGSRIIDILQQNGLKVYATYYSSKEHKGMLDNENNLEDVEWLHCDITNDSSIRKLIENIYQTESKIDVLINTATSKLKLKLFDQLTYEDFLEDMQVILIGSINLCKQIIPLMKRNKSGMIINLLTESIESYPSRMSSYITAKSGLLGLTKCLARELKPFNINVFGISPSFVETDLIKAFPEKLLEIQRESQPEKKFIQPEDIAKLTLDIVKNPTKYELNTIVKTRRDIEEAIKNE